MDPSEFQSHLSKTILPFLPVLFGAVEFIKWSLQLDGKKVTAIAVGIIVFYGALSILAFFFPSWGSYLLGGAVFLLMCALAPSGFYKFIAARAPKP